MRLPTHQRKNLAPSAEGLPAATAATCKQYTGQGEVFLEVSGFRGSELGKQSQRRDSESVPRDMQRTRETHYWLPRQHPSMGPWLHAEGHLRQGPSLKALLPCRTLHPHTGRHESRSSPQDAVNETNTRGCVITSCVVPTTHPSIGPWLEEGL